MGKRYETERLVLKVLEEKDAGMVLEYYDRNREFLKEWEPVRTDAFYEKAFHEKELREDMKKMEKREGLRLWIFLKGEETRVIGAVAFSNIVRGVFQSCHLGYKLDRDAVGKGYAREAVARGVRIMFDEHHLHRIEANIMPRNTSSRRVVESLGFEAEGLARKYLRIGGVWEDHIHWVILNEAEEQF
ncbi:MAG TPA: GNAT family N-acetyltransferase [Clostridiaceae bacterium]|nr:GNAT family N-acetyltransferase [Clostridiaceae bacterium]